MHAFYENEHILLYACYAKLRLLNFEPEGIEMTKMALWCGVTVGLSS